MERVEVSFVLNGREVSVLAKPWSRLLDLLRDDLGFTGTKEGCGEGECGACTIIVDGQTVNSCLYPALEVDGCSVTTVEGLALSGSQLSPLQDAFVEAGATQCGFCTPGMIMSAKSLLDAQQSPSDDEIREALVGNLCRCTGYVQIVDAIREASGQLSREGPAEAPGEET